MPYTPPVTGTGITIGGVAVTPPREVTPRRLIPHVRKGVPTFAFEVRGGSLPDPDPYLAKEVQVYVNGTLYFTGDVLRRDPDFREGLGWVRPYQCLGLRHRADKIPHTDSNDLSDSSAYNMAADNQSQDYLVSRSGRTVGEILTDVLTGVENATALDALGLCAYTSLTPPTLPASTVADLAALTLIPPAPVYFGGEKLGNAIDGFLGTWAPNHAAHFEPDGTLRVRDTRTYAEQTLTLNDDPILPTPLSRDLTEAFQRVRVRGQAIAEMFMFSLQLGTLTEEPFAHDGLTVADAKAAWTPAAFYAGSGCEGTCVCTSTTTVELDPSDDSLAFAANYWDYTSTGKHGSLMLTYSLGTDITTLAQRKTVASDALSSGGVFEVTVDRALPHTDYDAFVLTGTHSGASSVWTEYKLPDWAGPKVARQSTYPFAWKHAGGTAASLTSLPTGTICTSLSGLPPYNETSTVIEVDPDAGTVRFGFPTYITAGNKPPDDVRALVPIYTGVNEAIAPPDATGSAFGSEYFGSEFFGSEFFGGDTVGPQYDGDSHTVEGMERTLTVTVPAWRDPGNQAAMDAYTADILDSVKDAIVEGSVTFLGLYEDALAPGIALSIAGNGYTTGWEDAALPVVECQLEWNTAPGSATSWTTVMRCSNRRAHFTDTAFLKPDRTGVYFDVGWGGGLDLSGMGATLPNYAGGLATGDSLMGGYLGANGAEAAGVAGMNAAYAGSLWDGGDGRGPKQTITPTSEQAAAKRESIAAAEQTAREKKAEINDHNARRAAILREQRRRSGFFDLSGNYPDKGAGDDLA